MPFTANKLLSVQTSGSNSGVWGAGSSDALNEGVFEPLDKMLGGITSKSLTNVNVALTASEVQNGMLRLTGTLTGNVVISPDAGVTWIGFYFIENVTSGSFTVTITNSAGSVVFPQGRRGCIWIDTTNGPRIVGLVGSGTADVLPAGTPILFYQASVPSGWTATSLASTDRTIRIVGNGSGGALGGSVAFSTFAARTATDSHTLTTAQLPSHTHNYDRTTFATAGFAGSFSGTLATGNSSTASDGTGGGNGHTHNIDCRIRYADMVMGTRD